MQNELIYFYDQNCAHCYTETSIINHFAQEYSKLIPIHKINVEEYPHLAKEYQIVSTPTVVIIKNGRQAERFSHDLDLDQLKTVANYYFGGIKMKKQKTTNLQTLGNEVSLDAGICGPNGCVIDWTKAKKDDK